MNRRFSAMQQLLDRPVSLTGRLLVLAAIVVLLIGATLPLWRISLVAPQYAEGLTLDMYAYQIVAGNNGQDLAEINTLNHYIGMKTIAQADFLEMKLLPFAIGVFVLLALRAVVVGNIMSLVDLAVLFVYFGVFSLGSFAYRLYSYGHHLDPAAPMTIEPFMPVMSTKGGRPFADHRGRPRRSSGGITPACRGETCRRGSARGRRLGSGTRGSSRTARGTRSTQRAARAG